VLTENRHPTTAHATAPAPARPSTRTPRPELLPFREALARAMIRAGVSASELARRVWGEVKDPRGYMVAKGRDRMSAYMAGVSYPDPTNRAKIAEALDIDPQELNIEPLASSPRAMQPPPPAISLEIITGVAGEPSIAALTVNRKIMSEDTAMKIIALIREDAEPKPKPETPVSAPTPAPEPEKVPAFSLLAADNAPTTPGKKRRTR